MTICDDLRQSVLQAAIQGKLTKQLPEDGTAADLLASIKAEKEKLIKEKKIKKEKPLTPISADEIPFDIPDNWACVKAGYIFSLWDGPKVNAVRLPNLDAKFLRGKTEANILTSGKFVHAGDKMILVDGENSGEVFTAPKDGIQGSTFKLLYISRSINTAYAQYFLLFHKDYLRNNKKGSAIPHLNKEMLANLDFPIPPLAEQHRIVARVDELMAKIDELETVEKELVALKNAFPGDMKASLLQAAMQGKLTQQLPEDGSAADLLASIRAEKEQLIKEKKIKKEKPLAPISEDEIPFDIPDNWEWTRLPFVASTCLGKTINSSKDTGEEKPYLCSINVYWDGVNLKTVKTARFSPLDIEKYSLRKGDLLICEGGDIGRSAIWESDSEMYYQNALHRVRFYGNVNQHYFLYVLLLLKLNGTLESVSKGMTIKHLVQESLYNIVFPLPPLSEQYRIVEKLDKLLPLCDALKEDGVV